MSKLKLHKATVVMFEPDATMRLYRWWMTHGYWDVYCRYRISAESREMERKYPQLKRVSSEEFIEPMATLRDCVASPILGHASKKGRRIFSGVSLDGPHFPLSAGAGPAADQYGTTQNGGFAYVLMGYDSFEVRSWFPDGMQSRFATWQVQLPSQKEHDSSDLRRLLALGFFPACDRAIWRSHLGNSRVSENMSAGMGVLTNPPVGWASGGGVAILPNHLFARKRSNFVLSTAR